MNTTKKLSATSYPLCSSTWGSDELDAVERVMASQRSTMGPKVRAFEEAFAKQMGVRYAVMVNSGSSANLLAIAGLCYHPSPLLRAGDEVLTSAVSWGTTYFPLQQLGLKPRVIDVDPDTLNMDLDELEAALTINTRAIFAVNLLGNPNDFSRLTQIAADRDLILFEDNCESMGARFGTRACGSFGICGTFSTFFSHHLCTMEGGLITTDDTALYETLLCLRAHGWTRGLDPKGPVYREAQDPFNQSYTFVLPGYNLRPNEVSGALGCCQLKKLADFLNMRRQNAIFFQNSLQDLPHIRLQREVGQSAWFGFSLLLEGPLRGQRPAITTALQQEHIECRPIVAGNITRHPVWKQLGASQYGSLPQADHLHENGFFVGNSHEDLQKPISHLRDCLSTLITKLS